MTKANWLILFTIIVDVALILLTGFLCWLFKSLWGLVPLLFVTTYEEGKDE